MNGAQPHRGEVWLAELGNNEKTRPVVLVSREEAYARKDLITVAVITSRVRRIPTQVSVHDAGIPGLRGVINCDSIRTVGKSVLVEFLGSLPVAKVGELNAALSFALGLS